jgi:hypothetical protein
MIDYTISEKKNKYFTEKIRVPVFIFRGSPIFLKRELVETKPLRNCSRIKYDAFYSNCLRNKEITCPKGQVISEQFLISIFSSAKFYLSGETRRKTLFNEE